MAETIEKMIETPYYVKALAMGIPAIMLGLQISMWVFLAPAILDGHSDFRQLYTAAYMVRTGHADQIYDYEVQKQFQDSLVSKAEIALPFIRPAYQALLFVPLSFLDYRHAYFAFLFINLLLLWLAYRLLRPKMQNLADVLPWLPAALCLTFLPVATALVQGQDSIELLVLLAGAAALLDRSQDFWAGVIMALGLFKFQIAIPIVVFFLVWRKWKVSLGFAISACMLAAISVWLVGANQIAVYIHSLLSISSGAAHRVGGGNIPLRYATYATGMANLRGLVFNFADGFLPALWIQILTVLLSAVTFLWVAFGARTMQKRADALLIAITASTFLSYYIFIHDLSVLLIPIAIVLDRVIGAEATGHNPDRLLARAAALMFTAPICMSILPFHFYLVGIPLCGLLFILIRNLELSTGATYWERDRSNSLAVPGM
jgi:hypothetical protein